MPEYIKRCLQVIKENPEKAKALLRDLQEEPCDHGANKSDIITLHGLKTISVKTFCNFYNHAPNEVLEETIKYLKND